MVKLIWLIKENTREFWDEVVNIYGDVIWWWRSRNAERERSKLARLSEMDREQSALYLLEIASIMAEANRIDAETELVKI